MVSHMRTYSTEDMARGLGIHRVTLQRWLSAGKVRASLSMPMRGRTLWRWTDRDVERVRKFKAANYRKGRGRKKKPKA
jgi:predicted site-specific integrase-resolvase